MTAPQPSGHTRVSSVRITKADWTEATFSRCVADQFESETITVTSVDTGTVMAVFAPGTWREATTYGPDGYPQYTFTALID